IGAGYFAHFHVDAWVRLTGAELVAICDRDEAKARKLANQFGVSTVFTDVETMCREIAFEVADIITPPATHLALVELVTRYNKHVICQKPLAPSMEEAVNIHRTCVRARKRFMVHENFRFQPWHRELKRQLEAGVIGNRLHTITQYVRMGDGWPADAYLDRQPYFRTMPRLLLHETGIHFIDVLRYLAGEVTQVFAKTRTLNPHIAGEDYALVLLEFANGAQGIIDGNRYNEVDHPNPRYTFGTTVIEGNEGTLRLDLDGNISLQKLGQAVQKIDYHHEDRGFAGDCVFALQQHFLEAFFQGSPFETNWTDYENNLRVLEAAYESAKTEKSLSVVKKEK
ncbi:MAG: Gfo/Idh/MocA family oxidoreductase, partial [Bacteroidota bacterium]